MPAIDSQDLSALPPVQRIAVYAVVTDPSGGVLLLPTSSTPDEPGGWTLPGGELRHGEHPRDCVLRELTSQAGIVTSRATATTPRSAGSDVLDLPQRGISLHTLRVIYEVDVPDPQPAEPARFFSRTAAARLPLLPFVAELLGLAAEILPPLAAIDPQWPPPDLRDALPYLPDQLDQLDQLEQPVLMQRPAAYAVLIDEIGRAGTGPRMLLTRLAGSKNTWTLPGGGIDHGEHPLVALERELYEETGLPYLPGPLIDVGSRHFVGRSPRGGLEDFHGLRLVYAGSVPVDQPPRVIEVDGSTDLAAWVPVSDLARMGAVSTVRESYAIWQEYRDRRRGPGATRTG